MLFPWKHKSLKHNCFHREHCFWFPFWYVLSLFGWWHFIYNSQFTRSELHAEGSIKCERSKRCWERNTRQHLGEFQVGRRYISESECFFGKKKALRPFMARTDQYVWSFSGEWTRSSLMDAQVPSEEHILLTEQRVGTTHQTNTTACGHFTKVYVWSNAFSSNVCNYSSMQDCRFRSGNDREMSFYMLLINETEWDTYMVPLV